MEVFLHYFIIVCLIILALCLICCLYRAIKGPSVSDRIVAVNMIGSCAIMMILLISVFLNEAFLVDVSLLYAMLSFLAVVVLTKVYTGAYMEKKLKEEKTKKEEEKEND